jgi:hypothetical protein
VRVHADCSTNRFAVVAGAAGRVRVDAMTITGTTVPAAFLGMFACSGAPCE